MSQSDVLYFEAATIYARKIELKKELIKLTSGHRGRMARAWKGYVVIEKHWFKKK